MKEDLVKLALGYLYDLKFDAECGAPLDFKKLMLAIDTLCDALDDGQEERG